MTSSVRPSQPTILTPLTQHVPMHPRPVVFIGTFEHHSNILPWRESCADVVAIAESSAGGVDLDDLESKLKEYSARTLKIGTA